MSELIVLSSGFIIPSVYDKQEFEGGVSDNLPSLKVATQAYTEYTNNNSFENFMPMVDIFAKVLKGLSIKDFVKLQVTNSSLSSTGFSLCLDMLDISKLKKNYTSYLCVPTLSTSSEEVDIRELNKRSALYEREVKESNFPPAVYFLNNLLSERDLFLTVFKFILVGPDRGTKRV